VVAAVLLTAPAYLSSHTMLLMALIATTSI